MSGSYSHHFSRRNIPFGIASSAKHPSPQAVTRVQNSVIFLHDCHNAGLFSSINLPANAFHSDTLNGFAALPRPTHRSVRQLLQDAIREDDAIKLDALPEGSVEHVDQVTMHMPVRVGDFTDFSCSLEHVKNAGRIIINDERPPPAFFNLPIGYQGRASSIVVSGTDIERPLGQYRDKTAQPGSDGQLPVVYGPSRAVDYEMEFAAIIGKPLPMNARLKAVDVDEHIFGFALLNDWSSRDIQGYEMVPLGPLNGKSLGTTLSPWIVTTDALESFQTRAQAQTGSPSLPPYLKDPDRVTYAIKLQVEILASDTATVVGKSCVSSLYWSIRQMIAHVASAGSALRTGDIMATGTVTGAGTEEYGCLLEVTEGGKRPIQLQDGTERRFLLDGDVVRMTAVAGDEKSGVGFGECVGRLVPSRPFE